jgi:Tfp pilus assembly protein PilX
MTMARRRQNEEGWILVTSITLMTIMLVVALASMAIVDTQTKRSREQRERESSLNLAEGALYAQGFQLAQAWPGEATKALTADCSSATAALVCPTAAQVQQNADSVDTRALTTWTTVVRDNGGPNLNVAFQQAFMNQTQSGTDAFGRAYSCPGPCRWDANRDRKMWVQASSIVRGKPRLVVATMKLEKIAESVPRAAVSAGGINTGNHGGQIKIWGEGSSVVVRCNPDDRSCVSDEDGIYPAATNPVPPPPTTLMTPSQIQRMKMTAEANGTYYQGCPPGNNISGAVVFVEKCDLSISASTFGGTAACNPGLPPKPPGSGGGNGLQEPCINQIGTGGILIWHCGTMRLSGKATYVGLMYFVNGSDGTCAAGSSVPRGTSPPDCSDKFGPNNVLETTGGFGVYGALAVDGNGCMMASANGMQVQYDSNVWNALASYGTVGLVQDTWRELTPN